MPVPGSSASSPAPSQAAGRSSPETGTATRLASIPVHDSAWKRSSRIGSATICAATVGVNAAVSRRARPAARSSAGPIVTSPSVAAHESWNPTSPAQPGATTSSATALSASACTGASARPESRASAPQVSVAEARSSEGSGPASAA